MSTLSVQELIMRFLRDVTAISLGTFLGFVAIVHTHELFEIVYAFVKLQELALR